MYNEYRKDHNVNRKEAAMGRFLNPGIYQQSDQYYIKIYLQQPSEAFRKVNHSGDAVGILQQRQ